MNRILLVPVLAILLHPATHGQETPPPEVRVVQPQPVRGEGELRLPARTLPLKQAHIYSRATGVVKERRVDIGDEVKEGDVLAVVDAPEVRRSAEQARAIVQQAEARSRLADAVLERARTMARGRVIAEEALDEKEAGATTAAGELRAARAELARLEELVQFQTIRAPFDGVVAGRRVERGDHVQADQPRAGEWLFHIVKTDDLLVEVAAPPAGALRLQPGQAAVVTFAELPGREFPAKVARTSGVLDTTSGTMRVELLLPNPGRLLPAGLTGTAQIDAVDSVEVLRVPVNALLKRGGRAEVARVVDGRLEFTLVQTGRNFGNEVEILSGLTAGDQVVLSPNALLAEGQTVKAVPAPPAKR